MSITHITSIAQLDEILTPPDKLATKDKLTVIDFHASWCGPCHMIAPEYESLSKQYPGVNFLKCDVDAAKEVASRYSISAMPTFIFLSGSTKVDQVRGANKSALENSLRKFASESDRGVFTGKGQTLGDSRVNATKKPLPAFKDISPHAMVFIGLAGAYILFWCLS